MPFSSSMWRPSLLLPRTIASGAASHGLLAAALPWTAALALASAGGATSGVRRMAAYAGKKSGSSGGGKRNTFGSNEFRKKVRARSLRAQCHRPRSVRQP